MSDLCVGTPKKILWECGVVAGVSTLWLPQVARGLWWEEAAVVSLKLCGRDGQPSNPRAREGGMSGTTQCHRFPSPGSLSCVYHTQTLLSHVSQLHILCGHTPSLHCTYVTLGWS